MGSFSFEEGLYSLGEIPPFALMLGKTVRGQTAPKEQGIPAVFGPQAIHGFIHL